MGSKEILEQLEIEIEESKQIISIGDMEFELMDVELLKDFIAQAKLKASAENKTNRKSK